MYIASTIHPAMGNPKSFIVDNISFMRITSQIKYFSESNTSNDTNTAYQTFDMFHKITSCLYYNSIVDKSQVQNKGIKFLYTMNMKKALTFYDECGIIYLWSGDHKRAE